jgi:hypothetical protein
MQCARQSMAGARRRPPGCLQSISRILPLAALAALAAGEVQARPHVRVTMKSALGYAADGRRLFYVLRAGQLGGISNTEEQAEHMTRYLIRVNAALIPALAKRRVSCLPI